MTGYGRAVHEEGDVQVGVEILSVNRKHLDINIILPRHLTRFDPDVRKLISSQVFRGHLTVRITATFGGEAPLVVKANPALARQLYKGWEEIAEAVGFEKESNITLNLFENEPDLFIYEETEEMSKLGPKVLHAVEAALKPFMQMRIKEGEMLQKDIEGRLVFLKEAIEFIESHSGNATEKYRQKLLVKMQEVLPTLETTDERLIKEIALFSEKVDIAEEILRFKSHLDQLKQLLKSKNDTPGKTAEFLLQEFGREINTIGSKTSEIIITKKVVDVKAELERIREQIQNIE